MPWHCNVSSERGVKIPTQGGRGGVVKWTVGDERKVGRGNKTEQDKRDQSRITSNEGCVRAGAKQTLLMLQL